MSASYAIGNMEPRRQKAAVQRSTLCYLFGGDMKVLSIILALFFCTVSMAKADSGSLDSEKAVKALGDAALKSVVEHGPASFLDVVAPYWHISPEKLDSYKAEIKLKRKEVEKDYGKTLGYDLIFQKRLGNSLIGLVYIEKTEVKPVLWFLSFYKSADKWMFYSYYWNTNFEGLFFAQDK
jgi:hypothetical protein